MCYAAALIPAALTAFSAISQGRQQAAQASAAATNARTNALFAQDAAYDALDRGRKEAALQRIKTGQMIGTQRAAQAANGGLVNQDTNAILQEDTAQIGELDALTIENNAAREAYGYQAQALSGFSNARQLEQQSRSASRNSLLGGVISGASAYFGAGGGFGGSASAGVNLQGQNNPLYNNSAYVSRL